MLSSEPIDLNKVRKEDIDKEILRLGMIAELDAVSLYEQLAAKTQNNKIKKVLLYIPLIYLIAIILIKKPWIILFI